MKKLNKDSSTLKNSVEAYYCASCSFCGCSCTSCYGGLRSDNDYSDKISTSKSNSSNVRQY